MTAPASPYEDEHMKIRFHFAYHVRYVSMFLVLLAILAACAISPRHQSQNVMPANTIAQPAATTIAQPPATIKILGDSDRFPLNTPQLMCMATLVVDASISAIKPGHWNTPGNTAPPTTDATTILRQGYIIYTPILLSGMVTHVDHRKQQTSEFVLLGGQAGPYLYNVRFPTVTPGMHYLLVFVPASDHQTRAYTQKWLVVTDAFPIDAQGIVTLQPKVTEPDGTTPAVTMPLSQLTQQLATCN
jgi:hypothetical protein